MSILLFLILVTRFIGAEETSFGNSDSYRITISGNEIANVAVEAAKSQLLSLDFELFTVTPIRIPLSIQLSKGDYELKSEISNPTHITRGTGATLIWVKIMSEDKVVKSIPVPLKVRILVPMVVAKNRIKKHEILTSQNVCIKLCDVNLKGINTLDCTLEKRARKIIGKGHIITLSKMESIPLVTAKKQVKVVYNYNNVIISTTGVSNEDGWLNDLIKIQILSKVIDTKVVGTNCVAII